MAGNQNPTQSSLGGREDYQTVDGTINSNTGMAQVPNRMRNPNKPFRINTPLTNPQGSFNLGRGAWRPQLNSGPSEYRSGPQQDSQNQPYWNSNGQHYVNVPPPRKLKSSSPTQANPFPVGFVKPNTGSYTRPDYYTTAPMESIQVMPMAGQKASSLMEEFQDIDNFKMISEEDPQATYFGYERADSGPFEDELNLDPRGIRPGMQPDRAEYMNFQKNPDSRSKGIDQRRGMQSIPIHQAQPAPSNYRPAGPAYGSSAQMNDYESGEQQYFPPVNHRTDIKARSEKYKHELATKLTRIKNELNMNDSKIDNLLQKIGAGS